MDTVAPTTSMSVLGFVPALVVQYLQSLEDKNKIHLRTLPEKQSLTSVVMFADISGFTNLTETLSKIGPEGSEIIAFAINRYMELLVKGIGRSGGDIFKFAGDAMIVIWPPPLSEEGHSNIRLLQTLCKSAIQSALDLQNTLKDTNILENIKLSVKIGFGIGEVNIIHVGGVFARTEYIATGDPLTQAFESEHCASEGGQTIISQQVYELVEGYFDFKQVEKKTNYFVQLKKNHEKVRMKADALKIKNEINTHKFELMRKHIYPYIPKALLPYMYLDQERWSSELRRLTIMFVNLGIDLSLAKSTEGLIHIQKVIEKVQKCIYMHEGSLNKLLMDDKGSTLIVVFGLPPMTHQDDPVRAILCAFSLLHQLAKIDCSCAVGISTGTVFAGVVGTSGSRREYSVLGDQVNLAARLMGTACTDTNKIIICQETAQTTGHQIASYFYKTVMLKGKQDPIPIYIPIDEDSSYQKQQNPFNMFPDLKTHRNNFSVFLNAQGRDQTLPINGNKSGASQIFMIGRDEAQKRVQSILDKFMRGLNKQALITIRGTFGSGKTLFLRKTLHRIQDKINSNHYTHWKYGEVGQILTSCVGPISYSLKLCGLKSILTAIFRIFAQRVKREPDTELLCEMITVTPDNEDQFETFKEVLGLKDVDMIAGFPTPLPKNDAMHEKKVKKEIKQMTLILIEFLHYYFEEVPEKFCESVPERWQQWQSQIVVEENNNKNLKLTNLIAPLVICFDDTHHYDELSFRFIRLILKQFNFVLCIALIRDHNTELMHQVVVPAQRGVNEKQRKTQEEIFIEGMASVESVVDANNHHSFSLRGLQRTDKDDEFSKLIRQHFNILSFAVEKVIMEEEEQLPPIHINQEVVEGASGRKRGQTIILTQDVSQLEKQRHELFNYFLFAENKEKLFKTDVPLLFINHVYLKSSGNPHTAINFIQQYINLKFLKIVRGKAIITEELLKIMDNEELILVDAPICRILVNGPIIDKLSCIEQLLLKVASVIGDIFDVQTLVKIQPFKNVIDNQKVLKILQDLEQREIIEAMEMNEYNKYYRFTHSFFRECLYQRMTYAQRRQLHMSVAESIQNMPQVYESEEIRETKRLEFHWTIAETKWSLDPPKSDEQSPIRSPPKSSFDTKFPLLNKFKTLGLQQQQQQEVQTTSPVSYKAMRSIILKSIQNKLSRSNNDTNTIIKQGYLEKKSDQNITWAKRYCVMDGREFRYYYSEQEANSKSEPLSIIQLKHIYAIEPLDESQRLNSFQMSCTSWIKKSQQMAERKFSYAAENEESLEAWTIYIEFAKAKAVYDEFVNQFGKIQFPLGSQTDGFDQSIRFDVTLKRKPLNISILGFEKTKQDNKQSVAYRHSRVSNFSMSQKLKPNPSGMTEEQNAAIIQSNLQDFEQLKERVKIFLQKSTLLFYSHLFDMSIQRVDEYKLFGQPNYAVMKLNHLFKIEKKLLGVEQSNKPSIMSSSGVIPQRKTVEIELPVEQVKRKSGMDSLQKMISLQTEVQPTPTLSNLYLNMGDLEEILEEDIQKDDEELSSKTKIESVNQSIVMLKSEKKIPDEFISLQEEYKSNRSKKDTEKSMRMEFNPMRGGKDSEKSLKSEFISEKSVKSDKGSEKSLKEESFTSKQSEKNEELVTSKDQQQKKQLQSSVSPIPINNGQVPQPKAFISFSSKLAMPQQQSSNINFQSFNIPEEEDKLSSKHSNASSNKQGQKSEHSIVSIQQSKLSQKPQSTTSNRSQTDHKQNYFPQYIGVDEDQVGCFGQQKISGQHELVKGDYDSAVVSYAPTDSRQNLHFEKDSKQTTKVPTKVPMQMLSQESIQVQMQQENLREPIQVPMQVPIMQVPMQVLQVPTQVQMQVPMQVQMQQPIQVSIQVPMKMPMQVPTQVSIQEPKQQSRSVLQNAPVVAKSSVTQSLTLQILQDRHSESQQSLQRHQANRYNNDTSKSGTSQSQTSQANKPKQLQEDSYARDDKNLSISLYSPNSYVYVESSNSRLHFNESSMSSPMTKNEVQHEEPRRKPQLGFAQLENQIIMSSQTTPSKQQTQIIQVNKLVQSEKIRADVSPQPVKKKKKTKSISRTPTKLVHSKQNSYFGVIVRDCHSLRGDTFFLKKGEKVIVKTYKDNPNYVICSLGQFEGVFELSNISVLQSSDKDQKMKQSKLAQDTQDLYQNLLVFKNNRSVTPNKR